MADRTSAAFFADLFEILAKDEPIDRLELASELWSKSKNYDFSPYQMGCEEALMKLGLAEKCSECGYIVYDDYREHHTTRDCEEVKRG